VTKKEHIEEAFITVKERLNKDKLQFYALINNAASQGIGPTESVSVRSIRKVFEVNVFGVLELTQTFLPLLREYNGNSRIIFISSLAGTLSLPMCGPYCSSKFALESFGDSLRTELGMTSKVKVTLIEPGGYKSNLINQTSSHIEKEEIREGNHFDYYQNKFRKGFSFISSHSFPECTPVVDILEKVLYSKFPPTRAMIGIEKWFVVPLKQIPDSAFDFIIAMIWRFF